MKSRLARFICLCTVLTTVPVAAAEPILNWRSTDWRYCERDPGEGLEWLTTKFDDGKWPSGQAILGYGDRDIQTRLSYGGNPQNKYPAAFFRRQLRVERRARYRHYLGRIRCDDGAVVYVNGQEVFRHNMPPGRITNTTFALRAFATDTETERRAHQFLMAPQAVHDGDNVIAVSVHQANPTSSDLAFDMELVGLESDSEVQDAQAAMKDKATPADPPPPAHLRSEPVLEYTVTSP